MSRRVVSRRVGALALGLALLLGGTRGARAAPLEHLDRTQAEAMKDPRWEFCSNPPRPLRPDALAVCPLAKGAPGCAALEAACDEALAKKTPPKVDLGALERVGPILGAIGKVFVWLFVIAIAIALLVPIVRAILGALPKKDRDAEARRAAAARPRPDEGAAVDLATLTRGDALEVLARADRALAAGELDRSASLYLAAMLRALDARGHVVIAKHRTNGEYVRSCEDDGARDELREVVRTVDRAEFGGVGATRDRAEDVASRARRLVTALVAIAALALVASGCAAPSRPKPAVRDPAGNELLVDLLSREGLIVTPPPSSLATLPMPEEGEATAVLVVDAERTPLEEDSAEHLARWVEAGGALVLAGAPETWPKSLRWSSKACGSTTILVRAPRDPSTSEEEDEDDDESGIRRPEPPARLSLPAASCLGGDPGEVVAEAGAHGGPAFAVLRAHGKGRVLAMGSPDPLTNVALARPETARALGWMLGAMGERVGRGRTVWLARAEDGIPPPSNPLSALARAGLLAGVIHGLVFAALLFLAYGVRHARARPTPPPTRRAFVEHVAATGAFYKRRRASSHALGAYARWVEEELLGRSPRDAAQAIGGAARAARMSEEEVRRLLALAHTRPDDRKEAEDLADLRALSALVARLHAKET